MDLRASFQMLSSHLQLVVVDGLPHAKHKLHFQHYTKFTGQSCSGVYSSTDDLFFKKGSTKRPPE